MLAKHSTGILKGLGPLGGALLGTLGGTTIQKMGESSFGNIANPYKEMTFSGIGFREFAFNFVFRARSQDELNEIEKIIETFRRYSKPSYDKGSTLLDYPQEFRIEFLTLPEPPEDKKEPIGAAPLKPTPKADAMKDRFQPNTHIPQIKMCVCRGVTTNYTSQNTWRSLKNGAPVEVSLGLQFAETELVTSDDVIGTGKVGRFSGKGKF